MVEGSKLTESDPEGAGALGELGGFNHHRCMAVASAIPSESLVHGGMAWADEMDVWAWRLGMVDADHTV